MNFANLANIFLKFKINRYILILSAEQASWHIKTGSAISVKVAEQNTYALSGLNYAYELLLQTIPWDETGVFVRAKLLQLVV